MKANFLTKTVLQQALKVLLRYIFKGLIGLWLCAMLFVFTWAGSEDALFDENVLHTIRLTMAPGDWQTLRDRYREDIWFPATFEWQGNVVANVGVRSRGFASRSGTKPGLKIKFTQYVRGQHFLGLTTIDLKNVVYDTSMMRNRLAMKIFQAQGVVTPRVTHARVYVNDEYRGLYELQEAIDKPLLQSSFSEDSGTLYKCAIERIFNYYLEWRGDDPRAYIPDLFKPETNQQDLDPSALVGWIAAINNSGDAEFQEAVSQYLDWNELLQYLAIENAIAERDGVLGDWGTNNYYLYQYDGGMVFTIMPVDYKTNLANPSFSIFHNNDRSVLTRRALRVAALRDTYLDYLEEIVSQYVNAQWLVPQITTIHDQIRQAALEDRYKPYSNDTFEQSMQDLISFVSARPTAVREQIQSARAQDIE
jgi:hypothetical protein